LAVSIFTTVLERYNNRINYALINIKLSLNLKLHAFLAKALDKYTIQLQAPAALVSETEPSEPFTGAKKLV
jgi:hypothetical protein